MRRIPVARAELLCSVVIIFLVVIGIVGLTAWSRSTVGGMSDWLTCWMGRRPHSEIYLDEMRTRLGDYLAMEGFTSIPIDSLRFDDLDQADKQRWYLRDEPTWKEVCICVRRMRTETWTGLQVSVSAVPVANRSTSTWLRPTRKECTIARRSGGNGTRTSIHPR